MYLYGECLCLGNRVRRKVKEGHIEKLGYIMSSLLRQRVSRKYRGKGVIDVKKKMRLQAKRNLMLLNVILSLQIHLSVMVERTSRWCGGDSNPMAGD